MNYYIDEYVILFMFKGHMNKITNFYFQEISPFSWLLINVRPCQIGILLSVRVLVWFGPICKKFTLYHKQTINKTYPASPTTTAASKKQLTGYEKQIQIIVKTEGIYSLCQICSYESPQNPSSKSRVYQIHNLIGTREHLHLNTDVQKQKCKIHWPIQRTMQTEKSWFETTCKQWHCHTCTMKQTIMSTRQINNW